VAVKPFARRPETVGILERVNSGLIKKTVADVCLTKF
jgi:hypothetical protein